MVNKKQYVAPVLRCKLTQTFSLICVSIPGGSGGDQPNEPEVKGKVGTGASGYSNPVKWDEWE